MYLEPIQTSKMELFVKIVNSLMLLTILTNSSILDVWLGSNIATKSFDNSFCELNIFSFSSGLVKYFFPLTLIFTSSNIQKRSSSFVVQDFYFYLNEFLRKNIHKYANFLLSLRQNNSV